MTGPLAAPPTAVLCSEGVAGPGFTPSMLALNTLRGKDSREPPQSEEGARARTDASVSKDRRRPRLDDEARVKMDALSVSRLLAVAV